MDFEKTKKLVKKLTNIEKELSKGTYVKEEREDTILPEEEMKGTPVDQWYFTGDLDIDLLLSKCIETLNTKGKDYALGKEDRLHNFYTVADFTGMTPEQALGVYLYKHISAIYAYISNGKVESESIESRILDAINYLLLFHKMVQHERRLNKIKKYGVKECGQPTNEI